MAKLAALGAKTKVMIDTTAGVEISDIIGSGGSQYIRLTLKEPIEVRCSTDVTLGKIPVDEVYMREEDANNADWTEVDADGCQTIEGWVADFSTTHGVALFQEGTIAAYVNNRSKSKKEERSTRNLAKIEALRKAHGG